MDNFKSACRACLSSNCTQNLFSGKCSNDQSYDNVLMECADVPIFEDDGLSPYICNTCIESLESYIICHKIDDDFVLKCIESDHTLRNNVREPPADINFIKVESAPVETEEDSSNILQETTEQSSSLDNENLEISNVFECDQCKQTFDEKFIFDQHMLSHSQEVLQKDDECIKPVPPKKVYRYGHIRSHKCIFCEKAFSQKGHLTTHLLTHTQERPFKCSQCEKAFNQKSILTVHQLTHTQERKYKCDQCEKTFKQKHNLTIHLRTHSQNRPYKCDRCEKAFNYKKSLTRHLLMHAEERLYKCYQCEKMFQQKPHLASHLLTHIDAKPYKCTECPKAFSKRSHLNRHSRIHGKEKPFKCIVCAKAFNFKHNLKEHFLNVHAQKQHMKSTELEKIAVSESDPKTLEELKSFCKPLIKEQLELQITEDDQKNVHDEKAGIDEDEKSYVGEDGKSGIDEDIKSSIDEEEMSANIDMYYPVQSIYIKEEYVSSDDNEEEQEPEPEKSDCVL